MRSKILIFLILLIQITSPTKSQNYTPASSEILLNLKKLNTLGSVLYLAAHPDDENTRMIAYYANEKCMRTAYLSLTRGDGGQNLIGPEKAEKMGLIRTQELLEARKIDGGQQFFTRANDFGYSKHPDETLEIWGKQKVLSDVVWVIRKFRPDVIITRFTPNSAGMTHGHHTASAMLAKEAFNLANDKEAFPDHLKYVDPWQPKRIFWNTSWWFYGSKDFDKSGLITLDIGGYNKLLGKNYGEISGASRSMHKSQGFGASEAKGSVEEYLELLEGESDLTDPLQGINTTWLRIKGGEKVAKIIESAIKKFDVNDPSLIVPELLNARTEIQKISDLFWKEIKLKEVEDLIFDCLGFSVEALAKDYIYCPGDSMDFDLECINRSNRSVIIKSMELRANGFQKPNQNIDLINNILNTNSYKVKIPASAKISNPYWLEEKHNIGLYEVKDIEKIGLPENSEELILDLKISVDGIEMSKSVSFSYRWVDRVRGELHRDLVIAPPLTLSFLEKTMIFGTDKSKKVKMAIRSNKDIQSAEISFDFPIGWTVSPDKIKLEAQKKNDLKIFDLTISASERAINGEVLAKASIENVVYSMGFEEIVYEHIKTINYFPSSRLPLVNIDLSKKGNLIGYVKGAGDDVPEALVQMGYQIEYLDQNSIIQNDLQKYDAIIMGVRAYNTQKWLYDLHDKLMEYVFEGGNIIAQYNTNRDLNFDKIGPYKFELGRDRVTVEGAPIQINEGDFELLKSPNKITALDFENWVQERGLYFASSWDDRYQSPFTANDPGEKPASGMLINTKYGKGHFTYTGISFFRQLPAGVPGAYRLFANLISQGR